jgi:hypothetical protein
MSVKGIGSILFIKNGLRTKLQKNTKNHFKSNNYEVCTAVAPCFPNILDVIVLENVNLSSDRIGRPPLSSNETKLDFTYIHCQQCRFQPHFNFICTLDSIQFQKENDMSLPFILWTEFSAYQSTNLKRRWLGLFCNYYHIQYVCNHSTTLVFFFSSPELKAQVSYSDRPLSVCLSVCKLLHFRLLLQNHWANFNQTWHKLSLGRGF